VYRQLFELRLDRVRAALGDLDGDEEASQENADHTNFRRQLNRAQRKKLDELYRGGKISDETRRKISLSLDVEARGRGTERI
jgi:hypothetical protein